MGKTRHLLIFSLILLIFFACDDSPSSLTKKIVVSFDSPKGLESRTITPSDGEYLDIQYYVFKGEGPLEASFNKTVTTDSCTLESLPIGKWSFEVTSFNANNKALSKGVLATVIKKETNSITITLDTLVGQGTLEFEVSFNKEQIYGECFVNYVLKESSFAIVDSATKAITENQQSSSATFTKIPSGSYILEVSLICDDKVISALVESVRIIDGEISIGSRELVIGQLASESIIAVTDNTGTPIEGSITIEALPTEVGKEATLTFTLDENSPWDIDDLNFQWYCEGTPLENSNSPSCTIESLKGGTYRYDLIISNGKVGSLGSASVLVVTEVEITFN